MTLAEATAKRDEITQNLGISRSQYQGRSIDYPSGDARLKELAYLEDLIGKLQSQATVGTAGGSTRCTYGWLSRG